MKEYASVKDTWKTIFPEIMGSAGSIHIPMSRGLFSPEIHKDPPVPSELSVADLCTLALLNRWFAAGVRHAEVEPELTVVHEHFPDLEVHWAVIVTATENFQLSLDLTNYSVEKLSKLMPRGPKAKYWLGKDRIIQTYLELNEFKVYCILRPKVLRTQDRVRVGYTVRIVGKSDSVNIWDYISPPRNMAVEWSRIGTDEPPPPEPDPGDYWMGSTIIEVDLIHRHVVKRLGELG